MPYVWVQWSLFPGVLQLEFSTSGWLLHMIWKYYQLKWRKTQKQKTFFFLVSRVAKGFYRSWWSAWQIYKIPPKHRPTHTHIIFYSLLFFTNKIPLDHSFSALLFLTFALSFFPSFQKISHYRNIYHISYFNEKCSFSAACQCWNFFQLGKKPRSYNV